METPTSPPRGTLTLHSLPRILRELAAARNTGILHLSREGVSKRVHFKEGSIVFAGSDDEQERLGEFLIRAGKMKRSDLDFALHVTKETRQTLGTTAVEMGFLSREELQAQALERIKAILHSLFTWESGEFHFEERDAFVADDIAVNLSVKEIILEGIRSIEDPERIRKGLGDVNAVLRQPENPLAPYTEGSLSSSVEWILYQANGVSTIQDIVGNSPLDEERTLKSIYALVSAGLLEIGGEPAQAPAAALVEARPTGEVRSSDGRTPANMAGLSSGLIPQKLGRYEVQKVIGRGAMGAVLLARDPAIDRTVAVKLIQTAVHLSAAELEKYRERFYREARAAGKLLHPSIVTVFDVGHGEQDTPFIVMEYVEGRTLQEILKTRNLGLDESLRIGREVLDALGYAHSQGVVHRDIKPANILVTPEGRVKIMDFGIAHVVGSEFTQADEVLGSPSYMTPEQLSRGAIDARTDLFALGVVLYRMLTARLPFEGDSFASIAKAILFEEPQAPEAIDPAVPAAVGRVVLRCLAKDPAARFADAGEVKRALSAGETDSGLVLDRTTVMSSAAENRLAGAARSKTRRYLWAATGMVGLLGVGLGVFLVTRGEETRQPAGPELIVPAGGAAPAPSGDAPQAQTVPGTSGFDVKASEEEQVGQESTSPGQGAVASAEPRDRELYHEASLAFERADLQTSKAKLEELLRRNPGFEGGAELLAKVNDRLRNSERRPTAQAGLEQKRVAAGGPTVSEAELFYQARFALEHGELETSKAKLEDLLRRNPALSGASELLRQVQDQLWKKSLPIRLRAKHNHRIGGCTGTLVLGPGGVSFGSSDHDWQWGFSEIRLVEREGEWILSVETYEKDVLGLGKPKSYKFALSQPLREDDWVRYRRLLR